MFGGDLSRYAFEVTDGGSIKVLQKFTFSAHNAGKATEKFERTTHNLTAAMVSLGGFLTVRHLVEYADAWTLINSRVKIVTSSQQQAMAVQQRLFEIAQKSRNQLSATAVLYTRLAINADQLGRTQNDLLNTVEAVNNAVLVSGATGVEAAQSIRQLAQAFGKGKLDGDEFRTVMEAMPLVQRAIADEMGVPIGALQQLAAQGKITANIMIDAMLAAQKKLAEQAESMQYTIGQSYQILQNSFMRMIGIINMGYGASGKLADGIRWVADNLEKVIAIVPTAITMFAMYRLTLIGVAAMQAIVASQETIRGFMELARAIKAIAIAAFTAQQGFKGWVGLIGLLATIGAGYWVYKKAVSEITAMVDEWTNAQADLNATLGAFTPPVDPKLEKARQATEDMVREAHQAVVLAGLQGEAQEKLKVQFEAVNQLIEARRDITDETALAEREAAIRLAADLKTVAIEIEAAVEAGADALEERLRIMKQFAKDLQRAFADVFEQILNDGIKHFADLFDTIKQLFYALVAEMASAKLMEKFGPAFKDFLSDVFGAGSAASQQAAREAAEAAGRAAGYTEGTGLEAYMAGAGFGTTPVVLEGIEAGAETSWAKTFSRYLAPALAGFISGHMIGSMTSNPVLGTAGGALGGAATGAYVGSMIGGPIGTVLGGAIGGLTGAIGGLIGSMDKRAQEAAEERALQRQHNMILAQNNRVLENMRRSFEGTMNQRFKEFFELYNVATALRPQGGKAKPITEESIPAADLVILNEFASERNITLFDDKGRLLAAALDQLIEAVQEAMYQMTNFGNNIADIQLRQRAYNAIFQVEDTPLQQMKDAYEVLTSLAPDLMQMFGLSGLDINDPEARKVLVEGFKEIFNLIMSGGLTVDLLGAFEDKSGLIDAILAVTASFKELNKELYDVVTDFPRAMDIIYYEQKYGKYGLGDIGTTNGGTGATNGPGTTRTDPSGGGMIINGGVTIINEGNESGEEILDKIEFAAMRRRSRGGTVYQLQSEVS